VGIMIHALTLRIMTLCIQIGTNVSNKHTAYIFRVEGGGSIFLQNVGIHLHLPDYTENHSMNLYVTILHSVKQKNT
jgi:hypothetical protein